jgi:glycosyltransferase involved in cell wall biosynthesis
MKIMLVIHGYPMRYNAGSEVYTQGLALELAQRHDVHVFTRQENSFLPEYTCSREVDPLDQRVTLHIMNMVQARDRYRHGEVDRQFGALLDRIAPDMVHVGHLSHLSTSLILEASRRDIPVVFTLHDYWLMCPRGQFIQLRPKNATDLWALCDGQEHRKCAEMCYAPRYCSGIQEERARDTAYWTGWVRRRMAHIHQVCEAVDLFIAPSHYLLQRFQYEFGLPQDKLIYLDYGFFRARLAGRKRVRSEPFTFGYLGTHIPAKGVNHLLEAFGQLSGNALLRIWGRPRGTETESLQALAKQLPGNAGERVEWMGEYRNTAIVQEVFHHCDAVVVPSIWVENSPLVIHEALQARLPVITADAGGMAEYVHHEQNGLLFAHRDPSSLAKQMQRLVDDPVFAQQLGERGYLQSADGNIPDMQQHVQLIEALYTHVLDTRRENRNHATYATDATGTMAHHV